jgi:tetraacyldisaccharide 4'-kinase
VSSLFKRAASRLYGSVMTLRNGCFDRGFLSSKELPVPVISVGNLTVGGTGKTPVTAALARELIRTGKKVGIISRNYKADGGGMRRVDPAHSDEVRIVGDEPFLLAKTLPQLGVFVGPSKSETAVWALTQDPSLQVLVVDDGFQHRRLKRDFDIVLIDVTDEKSFEVVPFGRARESSTALERADWIVLTKTNWAPEERCEWMRAHLPDDIPVTEARFQTVWPALPADAVVGVVAGIARTEIFFDQVKKKYFGRVARTWSYPDHHRYAEREFAQWRAFLESDSKARLLMTEKDAVKVADAAIRARTSVVGLEVEFDRGEKLFEKLHTLVR